MCLHISVHDSMMSRVGTGALAMCWETSVQPTDKAATLDLQVSVAWLSSAVVNAPALRKASACGLLPGPASGEPLPTCQKHKDQPMQPLIEVPTPSSSSFCSSCKNSTSTAG